MSLVNPTAAAQKLRVVLSVHVSRVEDRRIYSVGLGAQERLLSFKHVMTSEIMYQKGRLCQNAF